MASFTPDGKAEFLKSISNEILDAERFAKTNQAYDIGFKVILLILGICMTICSVISGGDIFPSASKILNVIGAIFGCIVTGVSAFAFGQFNFSGRWSTYLTKTSALKSLRDELILDPDAAAAVARLKEIREWDDNHPPGQLTPPKQGKRGPGT